MSASTDYTRPCEVILFHRPLRAPPPGAPVEALVDEYFALLADMKRRRLETAEMDQVFDASEAVMARVVDAVAPNAAGILAQLRLLRDIMETGSTWSDDRNYRLLAGVAAGVERLGRGGAA